MPHTHEDSKAAQTQAAAEDAAAAICLCATGLRLAMTSPCDVTFARPRGTSVTRLSMPVHQTEGRVA